MVANGGIYSGFFTVDCFLQNNYILHTKHWEALGLILLFRKVFHLNFDLHLINKKIDFPAIVPINASRKSIIHINEG